MGGHGAGLTTAGLGEGRRARIRHPYLHGTEPGFPHALPIPGHALWGGTGSRIGRVMPAPMRNMLHEIAVDVTVLPQLVVSSNSVRSQEQVAQGSAQQHGDGGSSAVLGPVVQQVAALAPGSEVLELAVGRIVVEVAGGEPDDRPAEPIGFVGAGCATTAVIAPGAVLAIEPTPISHAKDEFAMRPAAALAAAVGPPETNGGRQLWPVDGVEGTLFGTDRHRISRCWMKDDTDSIQSYRRHKAPLTTKRLLEC